MKTINRQDHLRKKINAFQKVDRIEQREPRSGICIKKGHFTGFSTVPDTRALVHTR